MELLMSVVFPFLVLISIGAGFVYMDSMKCIVVNGFCPMR
jgi:hypothetical protein